MALIALYALAKVRFLPKEITAIEFVPFCAFVGGIWGAYWGMFLKGQSGFPRQESFRGVILGAIFGLCFITFGAGHA